MEYTGIYNYTLVDFLTRKHYALWLENAVAIKKSLGFQRGKSDQLDAKRIWNTHESQWVASFA